LGTPAQPSTTKQANLTDSEDATSDTSSSHDLHDGGGELRIFLTLRVLNWCTGGSHDDNDVQAALEELQQLSSCLMNSNNN